MKNNNKELYIIKYKSQANGKSKHDKPLYIGDGKNNQLISQANLANRYDRECAIKTVGTLLVEHDLVTEIILLDNVPEAKSYTPPKPGLHVIINRFGDPVDVFTTKDVESIFKDLAIYDEESEIESPHSAWRLSETGMLNMVVPLQTTNLFEKKKK